MTHADPERTLFIICSKTFTTLETQSLARTARSWILQRLGEKSVPQHFAAVSVNATAMDEFGVHPDYRFAMWDWVGGRYSIWSSIWRVARHRHWTRGFRIAVVRCRREIDEHFHSAPWNENLPVLAGLLAAWNIDLLGSADTGSAAVRFAPGAPAGLSAAARDGEQRQARQLDGSRPRWAPAR